MSSSRRESLYPFSNHSPSHLCFSLWIRLFWEFFVNGVIQYVASVRGFIHSVQCFQGSSICSVYVYLIPFSGRIVFPCRTYHILSSRSSVDGQVSCSEYFLAFRNNAAMNGGTPAFLWTCFHASCRLKRLLF